MTTQNAAMVAEIERLTRGLETMQRAYNGLYAETRQDQVAALTFELAELRRIHDQTVADGVAGFKAMAEELDKAKQDAERYRYILDCDVKSAMQYLPDLDVAHYKATRRANADKAMRRTDAGAKTGS